MTEERLVRRQAVQLAHTWDPRVGGGEGLKQGDLRKFPTGWG